MAIALAWIVNRNVLCKDNTVIRNGVGRAVTKELIPAEPDDDSMDTHGERQPLIWEMCVKAKCFRRAWPSVV